MDHKAEFEKCANTSDALVDVYLFGWVDGEGNSGDYGLIDGASSKTFSTLINTTYMFQPEPKFTLQSRPFKMSTKQFVYLQDNDLDTEEFLSSLGALPEVAYSLNLSKYSDASSALVAMATMLNVS